MQYYKNRLEFREREYQSDSRFYADNNLIESTNKLQLQEDTDVIINLFKKVGLMANEKKTKFIEVRGIIAPKTISKEVYNNISQQRRELQPTLSYKERCKQDVEYVIYRKKSKGISLLRHLKILYNKVIPEEEEEEDNVIDLFRLDNFTKGYYNKCPVLSYSGGEQDTYVIYNHFASRYPNTDIRISGDRNVVKCNSCGQNCHNLERYKKSVICKKITNRRENVKKHLL